MRYTPAAVALSLVAAVSSSVLHSEASETLDPRASALMEQGQASLKAGATGQAVDAFEAALAVEPGSVAVLVALAEAERAKGLTGKAIRYYRIALERDPRNLAALAGRVLPWPKRARPRRRTVALRGWRPCAVPTARRPGTFRRRLPGALRPKTRPRS